jgi:hypothetical protein
MKTEIILCDKCKMKVAEDTCKICECDVCDDCSTDTQFGFHYNESVFTKFKICKECKRGTEQMLLSNQHDKNRFNGMIIKYLKDNLALKELRK